MANSRKLSLQEEIERDVQKIEKEIAEHPELEQIQVTETLDAAILSKIKEYEKEKAEEEEILKLPEKKVVYHKKKKIRWFFILAAVLVLVLGVGMTSVGSKSYWKELLDVFRGEETAKIIDVEDMEKKETEDIDEVFVYQEIKEKLGITPVEFRYKPKKMNIVDYEIDEQLRLARLLFEYKEGCVRYTIYASDEDSSWTGKEEDEKVEEYILNINNVEINIEEIQKPKQDQKTMVARFEYQGGYYELKGEIEKEEFDKILQNLYFW